MMRRVSWLACVALLAGAWLLLSPPQVAHAQIGGMTCLDCHVDPAVGSSHGGFRALTDLTNDQIDVICMSCHDGSFTNPQGIQAPEAAVHQNRNPGAGRDEYGDFKAGCLDCHYNHSPLLAGDGTTGTVTITGNASLDEAHVVDATTTAFLLEERGVTAASIIVEGQAGAPNGTVFVAGTDYSVALIGGDPISIRIIPGGAIANQAPIAVVVGYEFATNQQLLGTRVDERSSTDGLARIRQPNIVDPSGNNNGTGRSRFEDDFQNGFHCSSGIPDDPACLPDQVRELIFHEDTQTAGTNWVPTIISTQPANTTGPRNGACNSCHTRTSHHRRNDLGQFGGGDDHNHNIDKNCDQCHNHRDAWVNKGG